MQQSPATSSNQPRTLVLCFDGTGNAYNNEVTNVVRMFSALEKEQRDRQLCYYQPGIGKCHNAFEWSALAYSRSVIEGTYVSPTVALAPMFRKGAELIDQAIAWCVPFSGF